MSAAPQRPPGSGPPGSSRHYRGKPRPGRRIDVHFRRTDGDTDDGEHTAATRNFSLGGAFIATERTYPPGSALTLTLAIPNAERGVEVRAEVRWVSGTSDEDGHGMGVRFLPLGAGELATLQEYFASHTETVEFDEFD